MNRDKSLSELAQTARGVKLNAFKELMKLQPRTIKEYEVVNDFKKNPRTVRLIAEKHEVEEVVAQKWITKFCKLNYTPRNDF